MSNKDASTQDSTSSLAQEFETLIQEKEAMIETLATENAELKDQSLRSLAELQNAKRRMEQDKQEFIDYATLGIIQEILPVLDNLKRANDHLPESLANDEWVKGILQIEKQCSQILSQKGLEVISPAIGGEFDAHTQESVMQDPNEQSGIITQVFEIGYKLKNRVIRPAKVVVGTKEQ